MVGLEKVIAIVEIEEEKQNQPRQSPQPSSGTVRNNPRRSPQMLQRIMEGEGSLAGEREGGESQSQRKSGRKKG